MRPKSHLLLPALLALCPFATVSSQDADAYEPARCISVSRIDDTEVIDARTIVFYLRGRDIYVNRLDRACARLDREQRFSYRVTTGQLCANDLITVIEDSVLGIAPGVSCSLGVFRAADEEMVEMLKGEQEPAEAEVTVEEIEVEE